MICFNHYIIKKKNCLLFCFFFKQKVGRHFVLKGHSLFRRRFPERKEHNLKEFIGPSPKERRRIQQKIKDKLDGFSTFLSLSLSLCRGMFHTGTVKFESCFFLRRHHHHLCEFLNYFALPFCIFWFCFVVFFLSPLIICTALLY